MNPCIEVVHARHLGRAVRARILALCSDAYEEEFKPPIALLADATHVLATMAGELIAHAALVHRELRVGAARRALSCAEFEAVSTPVRLQRRGFGSAVLRAIPALVTAFDIAALSPSEPAYYARSGWALWQGPLFHLQDGQRHRSDDEQVVVLRPPRTPAWLDLHDDLETDWREGDAW